MYEFIAALILIFFSVLLVYTLFMNLAPPVDMFKDLTRWKNTNVFYKYDTRMGCTIFIVYIYSEHRNKIREVDAINVTKFPGHSKDFMINYILERDQ